MEAKTSTSNNTAIHAAQGKYEEQKNRPNTEH